MADNQVDVTEGAGKSIATRTIGGKDYQQVIIADRTTGEAAILDIVTEDTAHTTGDTGIATMAVRADAAAGLPDTDGDYTPLIVDADGKLWVNAGTVPITAAALPLPSGAATQATLAALLAELQGKADTAEAQTVDGSAVTHPISAAALPLPSGAATAANQATANGHLAAIQDRTLTLVTGTASTSGDNTLIAAPGASTQIVIDSITLQNESATATTMIVKFGTTAKARILGQNQGDGAQWQLSPGARWEVGSNLALVLNLSGANSCGYTVAYYTESV